MEGVTAWFSERDDGQIDAHLPEEWRVFNEALGDSISTLPPRGEPGPSPSTYWIDKALSGAELALEHGTLTPFTWGNITYLRLNEGREVVAGFDFDPDEDEAEVMPVSDFVALLQEWRSRVVAARALVPRNDEPPETYRRNPIH